MAINSTKKNKRSNLYINFKFQITHIILNFFPNQEVQICSFQDYQKKEID